jgi:hypothetical protein
MSTSFCGVSAPISENIGCVVLVLVTVSGVGLIFSFLYLFSACFCSSVNLPSAMHRRKMADEAGRSALAAWTSCGLFAASDPNCVFHWSDGAVRVMFVAGRAAVGAATDLNARRDAPLRSILDGRQMAQAERRNAEWKRLVYTKKELGIKNKKSIEEAGKAQHHVCD